ncbi:MAG: hypothetical protein AB7I38_00920 [Dehalococcoidia bacterium]
MRIGGNGRRRLLAVVVALAAFAAGSAVAAAALSLSSGNLGANGASVSTCDADGFVIDGFTLNGSDQITHIAISGISGACIGGELTVDLTDATEVSVGTGGPVTVTGGSATVGISPNPLALQVKHEVIIIVGP